MSDNIHHIDDLGKMLQDLLDQHRRGEIIGLVVGYLTTGDRFCMSQYAGLTYLERLGLAENLKYVILRYRPDGRPFEEEK